MKKTINSILFILVWWTNADAQEIKTEGKIQLMQLTTIESVLAGGLGRSKVIITNSDGTQEESDFNNLFSAVGINFKNIRDNDVRLLALLKSYLNIGWKIEKVIPLTLSQGDNGTGGIFMTRYLLLREAEEK